MSDTAAPAALSVGNDGTSSPLRAPTALEQHVQVTGVRVQALTPTGRPKRPVRIQVYERKGKGRGTYDFRFLAPNGAVTSTSGGQGYTSRRDAHRALNAYLRSLLVPAERVHIEDV